ncbi:MAG: ATP-binding cassette domain-containing protein, partial [Parvibaculaceae bacterium]|nr:ATP-binding cassette domain-containing protein [Parvibaculaceae bacterium]
FYDADELKHFDVVKPSGRHDVAFKNVHFSYEKTEVLSGISFDLREGESLALVGPSGAGKTTIARLLPRFWDVGEGRIEIGGVDIRHMTPEDLSAQMSFVFQETFLFSYSIENNIRIGREDATDKEVVSAAKAAQVHDLIMALPNGYDTKFNTDINLSGGEKQRICIARAILKDAPIMVLDEATSFADAKNEAELQKAINSLIKGKTLIVIAHRLSTIKNLDRIAVIVAGKIAAIGTHEDLLLQSGQYKKMWNAHSRARDFKIGVHSSEEMR